MPPYIPTRESQLVSFSKTFNTLINADPTAYGLTSAQTAVFTSSHDAFVSAYDIAIEPATNSHANIVLKNTTKETLIDGTDGIRELARIIQAYPAVTDFQRAQLGLTVRDTEPTPVPVPSTAPKLSIVSTSNLFVELRLEDLEDPDSRGKPEGAAGAAIMTFIGPSAPNSTDTAAWMFHGNTSKTLVTVQFPVGTPSGSTAWFTAVWFNQRMESGPPTIPISIQIPAELPVAA